MKLKDFKNMIDQAAAYAGDCDVDVLVIEEENGKEIEFEIEKVGHFHVVPDVLITIKKVT